MRMLVKLEILNTVSSLCEAALMLTIAGSENNLISEYDTLVKQIWQSLGQSLQFGLQVDHNVVDTFGATQKMLRPDLKFTLILLTPPSILILPHKYQALGQVSLLI